MQNHYLGDSHEVFKENYFNHFETSSVNPWLSSAIGLYPCKNDFDILSKYLFTHQIFDHFYGEKEQKTAKISKQFKSWYVSREVVKPKSLLDFFYPVFCFFASLLSLFSLAGKKIKVSWVNFLTRAYRAEIYSEKLELL